VLLFGHVFEEVVKGFEVASLDSRPNSNSFILRASDFMASSLAEPGKKLPRIWA
jgi:hypothetical protein